MFEGLISTILPCWLSRTNNIEQLLQVLLLNFMANFLSDRVEYSVDIYFFILFLKPSSKTVNFLRFLWMYCHKLQTTGDSPLLRIY